MFTIVTKTYCSGEVLEILFAALPRIIVGMIFEGDDVVGKRECDCEVVGANEAMTELIDGGRQP